MNTTITLGAHLLICGIIITIAVIAFILLNYTNKKENRANNRTNDMARYREYSVAKNWVADLDICSDIISRDAQRFEQIGELLGALPNMSPEQIEQEFAHMKELKTELLINADRKRNLSESINRMIARETKYIAKKMDIIQQKWPEDVKNYKDFLGQHMNGNN